MKSKVQVKVIAYMIKEIGRVYGAGQSRQLAGFGRVLDHVPKALASECMSEIPF